MPQRRTGVGVAVLGSVLIGAGVLWLLAALGVDLPVAVVTPALLIALGVAVVVSGLRGEEHAVIGLAVFIGFWLAVAAVLAAVVDVPLTGAVGDHDLAPTTIADLEDDIRLFAGTQTLDLRDLELPEGTTDVAVSTVLGEVVVLVPEGMAVRTDAAVAGGSLDLDGRVLDGLGLDEVQETDGWGEANRRVDLRLRVGLGEIRVEVGREP